VARLEPTRIDVYVTGTNIDGGTVDLGDGGCAVRIVAGTLDEVTAATRALAEAVEPACFMVRGEASAHAFTVDGAVRIDPVDDWAAYLARVDALDLVCEALLAETDGCDEPRPEHLPAVEAAVALRPDAYRPRAHLGWLLMRLDRPEDARRELVRALEAEAPDHAKAYAWANLGWALDQLGRPEEAIPWYTRAVETLHLNEHCVNLGMVCLHAGRYDEGWEALRPNVVGHRLRSAAEAMARMGRLGDARALLRAALETQPSLLDPPPSKHYPPPPDVSWATRADLAALVTAARERKRG
jgi:tetratricopeptide (TPR) repeat protein